MSDFGSTTPADGGASSPVPPIAGINKPPAGGAAGVSQQLSGQLSPSRENTPREQFSPASFGNIPHVASFTSSPRNLNFPTIRLPGQLSKLDAGATIFYAIVDRVSSNKSDLRRLIQLTMSRLYLFELKNEVPKRAISFPEIEPEIKRKKDPKTGVHQLLIRVRREHDLIVKFSKDKLNGPKSHVEEFLRLLSALCPHVRITSCDPSENFTDQARLKHAPQSEEDSVTKVERRLNQEIGAAAVMQRQSSGLAGSMAGGTPRTPAVTDAATEAKYLEALEEAKAAQDKYEARERDQEKRFEKERTALRQETENLKTALRKLEAESEHRITPEDSAKVATQLRRIQLQLEEERRERDLLVRSRTTELENLYDMLLLRKQDELDDAYARITDLECIIDALQREISQYGGEGVDRLTPSLAALAQKARQNAAAAQTGAAHPSSVRSTEPSPAMAAMMKKL